MNMGRQEGKECGIIIGRLPFKTVPVDRCRGQSGRRTSFQPTKGQIHSHHSISQKLRWLRSNPTAGDLTIPDMYDSAKKGAGRQHNRLAANFTVVGQPNTSNASTAFQQIGNLTFDDCKIGNGRHVALDSFAIKRPIRLRAWALDGGALFPVKQTILYSGRIRCLGHDAAKRINFTDEVALSEATNRRIA